MLRSFDSNFLNSNSPESIELGKTLLGSAGVNLL
jgi:hypothetical protein